MMRPLVAPITSHGDLAQRLAELRQLEREGCPQTTMIRETVRAYEEYVGRGNGRDRS